MENQQDAIREKGLEIFRLMDERAPEIFDTGSWIGRLMNHAMADSDLKVRLFRFVDVLPSLKNPEQVMGHIREYFLEEGAHLPALLKKLLAGVESGFAAGMAAELVRKNIISFSRTFIAGATPEEALGALERLWRQGSAFTVDILGEAALSEKEAEEYHARYLDLIAFLSERLAGWPAREAGLERTFPRLNVSVKVSSLYSRIGPVNHDDSVDRVRERLRPLFRAARKAGAFINLDMEMASLKNITLDAYTALLDEDEFQEWSGVGIALQAYLRDTWDDLQRVIGWAEKGGRRITVRLVKGAYWEYEIVTARQNGWPAPVFTVKGHTDWNFERCAELMLARSPAVVPALATHNVRSLAAAMVAADRHGVHPDAFEFQMLYGMAGPVKAALRRMGHAIREYAPTGELLPGMAYLVRRLLENTSNESFLRRTFTGAASRESLLAAPEPYQKDAPAAETGAPGAFVNEPLSDFSRKGERDAFRVAIAQVRGELGRSYPALIGSRERSASAEIISVNPARPEEVVGKVAAIDREMAEEALAAARTAHPAWAVATPAERAAILFRAAEIVRSRKAELAAWQILETGKSWPEADADVAEAIDYLEYYGREMIRLGAPLSVGEVPGEENRYFYAPRGVALIIAPWNFPLAISTGMVSAALVAGNAVLYKPSSLAVVNGWQICDIFRAAGLPEGVLNFIPGRGQEVGGWLAGHPEVDMIAFTGSREVGLGLIEQAARQHPQQRTVKRVLAEMGGKNAVIVDDDADLDQAVAGVLQSAFGYQGQKCSACSRVIVLAGCYDLFLERLAEAVKGIVTGPPEDPACFMGPLIDARARERVMEYLSWGEKEGRVVARAPVPGGGWFVPPTVIADLPPDSPLLREEIFGPVLAIVRAETMTEALGIANDSVYALTGGLYSRSPAHIGQAAREFAVGNLYLNRGITGAVVGRQPFGGFKLSGVGSKAGGPDYLVQFMEPRVVTENTLRRGFSPDVLA
jgi:RHH-type transcriptional regulator, proline utilization regulon repressor / proline dehydrogenase / delta 1-pyrroline-5-carboxylate dehydrogenase